MRHPAEIREKELAQIALEVRERMAARLSNSRVEKFLHSDPQVAQEFARQTWIVVREHLEKQQ